MESENFSKSMYEIFDRHVKKGLNTTEIQNHIGNILENEWVKQLLVFGDYFILISDTKTLTFVYASPSAEIILGYPTDYFKDITSLIGLFSERELEIIPQVSVKALEKIASLKYTNEDLKKLRFSRNNWVKRSDRVSINVLQHSLGLAFDNDGRMQLEMVIACDITAFNNTHHHFYRLSKYHTEGTEELLLDGVFETTENPLTPREREVFTSLIKGKTSEEISQKLNISYETVKTHRRNLLAKTNSERSIDLLRFGFANGLL